MPALCRRAGTASGRAWPVVVLLWSWALYQSAAQTAVPPCAEVRPLYACSMQITDLPPFSGSPTPEMLAANTGLSMGLQGLLSSDPDESCKDLSSSYGTYASEASSEATASSQAAAEAVPDPTTGRHGRRQQRPPRTSQLGAQQHAVAARSKARAVNVPQQQAAQAVPPQRQAQTLQRRQQQQHQQQQQQQQQQQHPQQPHAAWQGQAGAVLQPGASVAAQPAVGPAARAYKYRISSLGAASAAAGNLTAGEAAAAGTNITSSSSNTSASTNSSSSSSKKEVWTHTPSGRGAHRRQQQQQQQQQLAKSSRHLLAETAAASTAAAAVSTAAAEGDDGYAWLDGLFGGDTEDTYDTKAADYVEKQFCGKGTWMATLSSSHQSHLFTPAALSKPGNASLVAAAALGSSAGDAAVSISGHKHHKQHKGAPHGSTQGSGPDNLQPPKPHRRTGFKPVWGDDGLWMSESGVVPADSTVAAGPHHVVHIVNSLVKIMPVDPARGVPDVSGTSAAYGALPDSLIVTLPDFFGLVASSCDGGYITPSAAFDKQVDRFVVTAVCGGDANQILLAVSQTWDATGGWWLYSFPAYVTYDTAMACADGSTHLNPTSIHTQVGYNRDGVFISFVQNCPLCHVPKATGSVLYALPKWALYTGSTHAVVGPVYTGVDVLAAVGEFNDKDFSAGSFRQLQPVMPQRPVDVQPDVAYFVNDPISDSNPYQRKQLATVALINTGSLWQYTCADDPAPVLVARVTGRGVDCSISSSTQLHQPQAQPLDGGGSGYYDTEPGQCPCLDAGATRPLGFWSGGAALFANQIYLTDRGPDLSPSKGSGKAYDSHDHHLMFPSAYWAVLSPSLCATGTCAAFMGQDWGYDDGWDWSRGAWLEHDMPKKARLRFFKLHPHLKADQKSSSTPVPSDPLTNFLTSLAAAAAPKGRHLQQLAPKAPEGTTLGAAKVASEALVSIAAVGPASKAGLGANSAAGAAAVGAPAEQKANSAGSTSSKGEKPGSGSGAVPASPVSATSQSASSSTRHVASRGSGGARRSPFLPQASSRRRSFTRDDDDDDADSYDEDYDEDYYDYDDSGYPQSEDDADSGGGGSRRGDRARTRARGSSHAHAKGSSKKAKPAKQAAPTPAVPLMSSGDGSSTDSSGYGPLSLTADELDDLASAAKAAPTGSSSSSGRMDAVTQQAGWETSPKPQDSHKPPVPVPSSPALNGSAPLPGPVPTPAALPSPTPPAPQPPAPRAADRAPVPEAPRAPRGTQRRDPHGQPAGQPPRKQAGLVSSRLDEEYPEEDPHYHEQQQYEQPQYYAEWSYDWPEPAAPRAPKPFKHPGRGDDSGSHPREYAFPHDEAPYQPAGPHHKGAGKGGRKPSKQPFPSKKDLATKTVWELMLQAADKHPTSPAPYSHREYYELWREHPAVRRVYCKLEVEPCYNPCKFYRHWYKDTSITFGVVVSRRGVIDTVTTSGDNPIGLAFPQVVVREGSALIVYSYSGPQQVPGCDTWAFPGVGYSVIPPGQALGSPSFNLLQPGDGCIYQGPVEGRQQQAWGSYSGADVHFPSAVAYTAVQYSTRPGNMHTQPSNAGTWLQAFAPAKFGWKQPNPHSKPPPRAYVVAPPAYDSFPPAYGGSGSYGKHPYQPPYGDSEGGYAPPSYAPSPYYKPHPPAPPPKPYKPPSNAYPYYPPKPEPPSYGYGGMPDHIGGGSDDPPGGYNPPGPQYDKYHEGYKPSPTPYKPPPPSYGDDGYSYPPPSPTYKPYPPTYGDDSYHSPSPSPSYKPQPPSYGGGAYPTPPPYPSYGGAGNEGPLYLPIDNQHSYSSDGNNSPYEYEEYDLDEGQQDGYGGQQDGYGGQSDAGYTAPPSYGGSYTKPRGPSPQTPKYVNFNPHQKDQWISSHAGDGTDDGDSEWDGDASGSYGAAPAPYQDGGGSGGDGYGYGYGYGSGKHDVNGGFVLAPGGHMNGGQFTNKDLLKQLINQSGGGDSSSSSDGSSGSSDGSTGSAGLPGGAGAEAGAVPVGQMQLGAAQAQRAASNVQLQQQQQRLLEQQQQLQQLQLQKAQLAKQQQQLKEQLQEVRQQQQQQQQQQPGLATSQAQPQKGMVLPATGLEGSDLSHSLVQLGSAASSSVQQLLAKLGLSGSATPRQVAKAVKHVQRAERRAEKAGTQSSAVSPPELTPQGEAAVQYFDDYEVKGESAAAAAPVLPDSTSQLVAYLQGGQQVQPAAPGAALQAAAARSTATAASAAAAAEST